MKNDQRSMKTKHAITGAFLELMEEVGFSKINVRMIIERADINRSTFYLHYLDKYDLLDQVEEDILSELKSITEEAPIEYITFHSHNVESLSLYANKVTEYLFTNGKAFTLLMGENGDPAFIHKISEAISSIWNKNKIPERLSISLNYTKSALIGCVTYLISEWVKNDFDKTKEEFSEIMLKFIHSILDMVILK